LPTRSKKHRVSNRRELIIKTASRLFRAKGYERTTVRDLADAVGMHSGSLFFHFRSKEEILLAVLENGLRHSISILARGLANAHTPTQKLAAICHGHLKAILEEERDTFTVILSDWYTLSPKSRKKVIALRDQYEGHIDRALKEIGKCGLVQGDTRVFRFFLLGALNWTVQWYRADGGLTVDQLAEEFLSIILRTSGST
jgi:TetR/AcrR family transcriptional regulator, cholesterol catabolism regulator